MKVIFYLTGLFLLSNCNASKTILKTQHSFDGDYHVTLLNGTDVSSYQLTFQITKMEKIIGGFAGCNQFFGTISQNKNLIVFSKIGATKIYCSQKDVIAIEREYLTGLSITSKYEEQKNGIIELLDEKNRVILVLEPVNN